MTARTRATTARTPKHHIPIGLQLAARAFDPDIDYAGMRDVLTRADRHAARILHDPLETLKDDGAGIALSASAEELGADDSTERVVARSHRQ